MDTIIRFGIDLAKNSFAICEAAGRPHMRFVPIKSAQQQAVLLVHRLRRSAVAAIPAPSIKCAACWPNSQKWPRLRSELIEQIPPLVWQTLDPLFAELRRLHDKVLAFDRQINQLRDDERACRLTQVTFMAEN